MLKTVSFLFVLVPILTGCATHRRQETHNLEVRMQQRIGQTIDEVVADIGPPTSYFPKPDGETVYTWKSKVSNSFSRAAFYSGGSDDCDVSYTVGSDGKIKSANHFGNGC